MSKTLNNQTVEWRTIPWRKLEVRVFKLQKRIFKASSRGDVKAVRRLQKTLMKSWSGKCLAVRKVTQDNQGKRTAGVDGLKNLSPHARLTLVRMLKVTGKSKPTRRVWIDKPGKAEKRPLGIPTMFDRALQALVKLALEPEWEAKFEGNSFGFRPGRSAHDAIDAIFKNSHKKAKFVLDADIAQCFDRIDHNALLGKLNTFPTLRRQIKAWLQSGVMDSGVFSKTDEGTPQGGVISPLLANIALHGFEEYITRYKTKDVGSEKKGNRIRGTRAQVVRYADDFVVLHESEEFINILRQKADEWLKIMGLELKPSKTRVCHTNEGFDFLGFNVRQYPVGAYRAATVARTGKEAMNLGFCTIIKPTKEAVKRHLDKIGQIIDKHHNAPQQALISRLNPVIRGWCNYYASVVSKETFNKCDHLTYQKLRAWAKRRCKKTNAHGTVNNYWRTVGEDNWTFATSGGIALVKHSSTPIVRHTKVQGARSPFDGDLVYWGKRMSSHPELPSRVATLLKSQSGKCELCGLSFKYGDLMEVDHKIRTSLGGKDVYSNLELLHRHCHDLKTATDGDVYLENWDDNPFYNVKGTHNKSQVIEEPYVVKITSTVLKERGNEQLFPLL